MEIDEVKKEILDNARKHANELLKEEEKERKAILKNAESKVDEIKEKYDKEAKENNEKYRSGQMAELESAVKKEKLALEKKMLDKVFSDTLEELRSLSGKKRESHLKKLLSTDFRFEKVYCSKKDMAFLKKHHPVEADIAGGVILEDKEGTKRIDLSYESILDSVRQGSMAAVSERLYAQGK
ncbi:hypothetical protein JXC34_05725 [Candidatus Woesearchaeota archaeon]|nr:hypothetical protein [Candidatus Woesearchaeota archaeon]